MAHRITIRLSTAAQRAAILAGEPAARVQTYDVDHGLLGRLLALPWTTVGEDGTATCDVKIPGWLEAQRLCRVDSPDYVGWSGHECSPELATRPKSAEETIAAVESLFERLSRAVMAARKEHFAAAVSSIVAKCGDGSRPDYWEDQLRKAAERYGCDVPPILAEVRSRAADAVQDRETKEATEKATRMAREQAEAAQKAQAKEAAGAHRRWLVTGTQDVTLRRNAADEAVSTVAVVDEHHRQLAASIVEQLDKAAQDIDAYGVVATYSDAQPCVALRSPRAYALHSALTELVLQIDLPNAPAEVTVGDLAYHDVAPVGGRIHRLGYEITVAHPWYEESFVVLLDPPPPEYSGDCDEDCDED